MDGENNTDNKSPNQGVTGEVVFHFIKSPHHRVIRVSGAVGGLSPNNEVAATLYVERLPIPESVTHEVSDGRIDDEFKQKISKVGIVREAEVTLSIDPRVAKSLALWLLSIVKRAEDLEVHIDQSEI